MNCVFCKIINGEIPSAKVYEDTDFLAILDINPVSKGHVLVLPKKHCENLFDMDDELLSKTLKVLQKVGKALKKTLNVDGINLIQNNGKDAGQIIFHSHFHLIPRTSDDDIKIGMIHKKYEDNELNKYAELIKKGF